MDNQNATVKRKLRTIYWGQVFVLIIGIYSTLYIVRPICEFLKKILPLGILMNVLLAGVIVSIILIWRKYLKKISTWCLLGLIISIYIFDLLKIQYPEEKFHYLEYGLLSFLTFRAVLLDKPVWFAYFWSFLFTSLIGWGDELIQGILPNRYYQLEDVILNVKSGALGLALTYIFRRDKVV